MKLEESINTSVGEGKEMTRVQVPEFFIHLGDETFGWHWRGRNPTAPCGRVLHLSVCIILRRTPCLQSGTTVPSWTQESHAKRREGSGSIILLFLVDLSEERRHFCFSPSFSVFWGRTNLKCPHMPARTGTKDFFGSSGIASRRKKDCPPRCSGILPEMLEIKEKYRRQWSWVTHFLWNQKLLLMGPDATNHNFSSTHLTTAKIPRFYWTSYY